MKAYEIFFLKKEKNNCSKAFVYGKIFKLRSFKFNPLDPKITVVWLHRAIDIAPILSWPGCVPKPAKLANPARTKGSCWEIFKRNWTVTAWPARQQIPGRKSKKTLLYSSTLTTTALHLSTQKPYYQRQMLNFWDGRLKSFFCSDHWWISVSEKGVIKILMKICFVLIYMQILNVKY